MDRGVVHTGARVSKMAIHCFWVTTSPGPATLLRSQHAGGEDVGRLATLSYRHKGLWLRNADPIVGHGERH